MATATAAATEQPCHEDDHCHTSSGHQHRVRHDVFVQLAVERIEATDRCFIKHFFFDPLDTTDHHRPLQEHNSQCTLAAPNSALSDLALTISSMKVQWKHAVNLINLFVLSIPL